MSASETQSPRARDVRGPFDMRPALNLTLLCAGFAFAAGLCAGLYLATYYLIG